MNCLVDFLSGDVIQIEGGGGGGGGNRHGGGGGGGGGGAGWEHEDSIDFSVKKESKTTIKLNFSFS